MSYALKKGTTSKILLVYALDAADLRSGKTGLSARTSGGSAAYIREGETEVRRITLAEGKLGEHRAICCRVFTSSAFRTRCSRPAQKQSR